MLSDNAARLKREGTCAPAWLLSPSNTLTIALNLMVVLGAIVVVVPFAWIALSSFKPRGEIFSPTSIFWPNTVTLENYQEVFFNTPLVPYFKNSVIATLVTLAINLPAGALAAYAFSRFEFRGKRILMVVILVTQLLPAAAIVVPLFLQWSTLRLLNSPWALGLTYAGLTLPLVILLLVGFLDSVPRELDEAAQIDGCSKMRAFWWILMPMLRPGLAAAAIFTFVTTWQEFLLAVSMTIKSDAYTLPVGLYGFIGAFSTDWGGIMAMAVVIALPAVLLFALLQKQFISSITGAVKG